MRPPAIQDIKVMRPKPQGEVLRLSATSVVLLACTASFVAAMPQDPVPSKMANKYSVMPVGSIGQRFDLSGDRALAWKRADGEFVFTMVAEDFVTFESARESVRSRPRCFGSFTPSRRSRNSSMLQE